MQCISGAIVLIGALKGYQLLDRAASHLRLPSIQLSVTLGAPDLAILGLAALGTVAVTARKLRCRVPTPSRLQPQADPAPNAQPDDDDEAIQTVTPPPPPPPPPKATPKDSGSQDEIVPFNATTDPVDDGIVRPVDSANPYRTFWASLNLHPETDVLLPIPARKRALKADIRGELPPVPPALAADCGPHNAGEASTYIRAQVTQPTNTEPPSEQPSDEQVLETATFSDAEDAAVAEAIAAMDELDAITIDESEAADEVIDATAATLGDGDGDAYNDETGSHGGPDSGLDSTIETDSGSEGAGTRLHLGHHGGAPTPPAPCPATAFT